MSREHVGHTDIVKFAQERVNLPKDKTDEYRAQARRLREKLEKYLEGAFWATQRLNTNTSSTISRVWFG
jgi:hypothetical protein